MSKLVTAAGTLRTEAIAQKGKGEEKTIISRWIDEITTAVAEGNVRDIDNRPGPTISARLYAMVGAAAYEAWQTTESLHNSTIKLENYSPLNPNKITDRKQKNFLNNLISETIFKTATSKHSGLTPEGLSRLSQFATTSNTGKSYSGKVDTLSSQISQKITNIFKRDGYDLPADYTAINSLEKLTNIDAWTPEYNASDNAESGKQSYLTPRWGEIKPFLISAKKLSRITKSVDEPQHFLLNKEDSYDLAKGTLTEGSTGETFEINPSLVGSHINPDFIKQAQQIIQFSQDLKDTKQGRINKATAEFWENGMGTPFPPGMWLVVGQATSLAHHFDIEKDAKLFLGLGTSLHGAGISAWDVKRRENYTRPVRTIRELSRLGLLTDEDPNTPGSQFRAFNRATGHIDLISGIDFETYQSPSRGYSPPFAEYTSGHSTFSSSAAAFLSRFSGQEEFPWNITMNIVFPFPNGEGKKVRLKYDDLNAASEAAGISRLYGGIHFEDANSNGLAAGDEIGTIVFDKLTRFWQQPPTL